MKFVLILSLATALAAPSAVHARPADDRHFVADAMKGDNSEVVLGNLAVKRGTTAAVRRYGQMLAKDHAQHRHIVSRLGKRPGVVPTTQLSEGGQHARSMMLALHGCQFDTAFRSHMIADHREDISKYRAAASSAASPAVRAMAKATLPVLRKHLRTGQSL